MPVLRHWAHVSNILLVAIVSTLRPFTGVAHGSDVFGVPVGQCFVASEVAWDIAVAQM